MSLRDKLNAVREEHGTLTPQLLVDVARDPSHPLHDRFEWDDSVAAEKWRLEQAGQLLRVTYRPNPHVPKDIRAYVAIRGDDTPRSEYVPSEEAFADPLTAQIVLRQMKREWQAFKRRYENHAEFAAMIRSDIEGQAS